MYLLRKEFTPFTEFENSNSFCRKVRETSKKGDIQQDVHWLEKCNRKFNYCLSEIIVTISKIPKKHCSTSILNYITLRIVFVEKRVHLSQNPKNLFSKIQILSAERFVNHPIQGIFRRTYIDLRTAKVCQNNWNVRKLKNYIFENSDFAYLKNLSIYRKYPRNTVVLLIIKIY